MARSYRTLLPLIVLLLLPAVHRAQTLPPDFSEALVAGGFNEPNGCTWDHLGNAYVWEKRGMVWKVVNGTTQPTPLIDLREEVGNWRDYGMLGFTLDPNFQSNGYIYLMYLVDRHHLLFHGTPNYDPAANHYNEASIIRITRYTAITPGFNTVDPASRFILFGEDIQSGAVVLHESHGPGTLAFGTDGTLLASIGDGASYYGADVGNADGTYHTQAIIDGMMRPEENVGALRAQMVNSFSGKILRLDAATGDGIASNPWYDPTAPRSPRSRVWAMGLRNGYRFTVRPGSGSTDPSAADPGTIHLGDVGWNLWEEINVCDRPGMNFGWPLFEGMDVNEPYWILPTPNMDAPNPTFNGINCTQQYFNFQDLIVQESPVHTNAHPNPCSPTTQIPNTIPKHFHARPWIDYRHGNQSRTKGFQGNTAVSWDLTDPESPVPGPNFGGFAAIGGPWMEGLQMPLGYQGAVFHGDYAMGFIKRYMFDSNDEPQSVHDFAGGLGAITWLGAGPDGCLWYIRYNTAELRRICYDLAVDLPPTAVASQNVQYGPSPLTVSFTGSNSFDPNGPVTWHWDFGDGNTSTQADPEHTYAAPSSAPVTYNVVLTVTDNANQTASTTLIVSLNNTPPVAQITGFPDGIFYPVGTDTLISLIGTASDAEFDENELVWSWQVTLHHNTHTHPEPPIILEQSMALISGVGCDGETYSYKISLTVTDPGGLSTTVSHWLYPGCHLVGPTAVIWADPVVGFAPLQVQFDGTGSSDPGASIVAYHWDFGDGTTSTLPMPAKLFTEVGAHFVTLTVTDDDGLTGQAVRMIDVITLDPPQCMGSPGGVLREEWTGILGSTVNHLVSDPAYAGAPSSSSILPAFQGPANHAMNYGARIRGYIVPQVTADYVFTVTSDDASVVYLSLNADPAHKQVIAHAPGWTDPEEFDKFSGQESSVVQLQAGGWYYVEVLHKQGGGGDHMTLWWQVNGGERIVIPGTVLVPWEDCAPGVQVRMLLQGAMGQDQFLMRDDLRAAGLVPQLEPYTALGMLANGGDLAPAEVFQSQGQNAIVDWVLIELRDPVAPTQVVDARAALVQRDGDVVGADGHPRLLFDVPPGEYHVVVRHRNHLGAMTADPVMLDANGHLVDMISPATELWGQDAQMELPDGRRALWMGNVNSDGFLRYTGADNDREPILESIGGLVATNFLTGYSRSDTNMDGVIKYAGRDNDRDPILINIGGVIPTAIKQQQLP